MKYGNTLQKQIGNDAGFSYLKVARQALIYCLKLTPLAAASQLNYRKVEIRVSVEIGNAEVRLWQRDVCGSRLTAASCGAPLYRDVLLP